MTPENPNTEKWEPRTTADEQKPLRTEPLPVRADGMIDAPSPPPRVYPGQVTNSALLGLVIRSGGLDEA
jgi:hypothetical protein